MNSVYRNRWKWRDHCEVISFRFYSLISINFQQSYWEKINNYYWIMTMGKPSIESIIENQWGSRAKAQQEINSMKTTSVSSRFIARVIIGIAPNLAQSKSDNIAIGPNSFRPHRNRNSASRSHQNGSNQSQIIAECRHLATATGKLWKLFHQSELT